MNTYTYEDVIELWLLHRGEFLDDIIVPQTLAASWLRDFGYEMLSQSLPFIIRHWVSKCEKDQVHPSSNLPYLRNYIQASLRNEKENGLIREVRHV